MHDKYKDIYIVSVTKFERTKHKRRAHGETDLIIREQLWLKVSLKGHDICMYTTDWMHL